MRTEPSGRNGSASGQRPHQGGGPGTRPRAHEHRAYNERTNEREHPSPRTHSLSSLSLPPTTPHSLSPPPLGIGRAGTPPNTGHGAGKVNRGGVVAEREATGDSHPRERRLAPPDGGRCGTGGRAGDGGGAEPGRPTRRNPRTPRARPPRDRHAPDATHARGPPGRGTQTHRHGMRRELTGGRGPQRATPAHGSEAQRRGKAGKTPTPPVRGVRKTREQAGEITPTGDGGRPDGNGPPARSGGGLTHRELSAASLRETEEEEGRSTSDSSPRREWNEGGSRARGGRPDLGERGERSTGAPTATPGHARGFISPPGHPPWRPGRPPAHVSTEGGRAGRAPART